MNVYCIFKNENGKKELDYIFEKSSRAYKTLERLREQSKNEDIHYSIKEMYVYKGEEPKTPE